jgi:hypothetical protein
VSDLLALRNAWLDAHERLAAALPRVATQRGPGDEEMPVFIGEPTVAKDLVDEAERTYQAYMGAVRHLIAAGG